jgi:hypothetical protein
MKMYFSRIVADHWCAKNKSEEAAHKLAHEMERRILTIDQVKAYKEEFKARVNQINAAHSRCKPLNLSIKNGYDNRGDIIFWMDGVFHLELILAKES